MKTKKSFKGMTLVEIIVAMAILAVAGTVMCTACSFVAKMKVTTNALNKRISYEAPIADSRNVTTISVDGESKDTATPTGTVTTYDYKYKDSNGIEKTKQQQCNSSLFVSDGTNTYEVKGWLYETNYNAGTTYGSENGIISDLSSHNFKFFVVGGKDVT